MHRGGSQVGIRGCREADGCGRETNISKPEDTPPNSILYKIQEEERFAVPLSLLQLQEFPLLTKDFLSSQGISSLPTQQLNRRIRRYRGGKKKERKLASNIFWGNLYIDLFISVLFMYMLILCKNCKLFLLFPACRSVEKHESSDKTTWESQ